MMALIYAALAAAALSAFGTWKVEEWRHDSIDKARIEQAAKETARRTDKIDSAAVGHEADKKTLRSKFAPIDKEVDRVAQTDFYAAGQPACFDDDGLRQLRAAIATPAASASVATGIVPRPGGTHWWSKSGDSAVVR